MTATATTAPSAATIEAITQKAKRLSILSMMSTTAAGSGAGINYLRTSRPKGE